MGDDGGDDDDQPGPSHKTDVLGCRSNIDSVSGKAKSSNQLHGEEIVKQIYSSGVEGLVYSYR